MKILIVDDEPFARKSLVKMVREINDTVILEADSVDSAAEVIKKNNPDLLLLDIKLAGRNAFDLLELFPEADFRVIFVTAFDTYAIRAIKYSASDYILKPVDREELEVALNRVRTQLAENGKPDTRLKALLENLSNPHPKKLAVPDSGGITFVDLEKIIRCESDGNYTNIHLFDGKKMLASKTLGEFEDLLGEEKFFRVHRSHLINMDHIRKYIKGEGGYVELSDGSVIEVSRRKKLQFLEMISKR